MSFATEANLGTPEPIEESAEDEEMAEATKDLPAPGPLLEATAAFGGLLLLRSVDHGIRVQPFVILQELLALRIEGQRDRLLSLEEIHDGRRV